MLAIRVVVGAIRHQHPFFGLPALAAVLALAGDGSGAGVISKRFQSYAGLGAINKTKTRPVKSYR